MPKPRCRDKHRKRGRPGIGVLVDTLHFDRSGSTIDQVARTPHLRLPFAHVADAPVQKSYATEDCFTLAPRSGCPPSRARSTSEESPNICLMEFRSRIEVPMTAMAATESFQAVALHVRRAASRLLATNARRPRRGCAFFSSISWARRRSAKV